MPAWRGVDDLGIALREDENKQGLCVEKISHQWRGRWQARRINKAVIARLRYVQHQCSSDSFNSPPKTICFPSL
jgi:hypothetical protein